MRPLLDITDDLRALDDLLDECEGDISDPRVAEAVNKWFSELDQEFERKLDNYAAFITELIDRADFRKFEADRLAKRAKIDNNLADSLKARLKYVLEQRNTLKIDTPRYKLSVVKNGGKTPVEIYEPASVPKELCRHIPERWEPDADMIREVLEDCADVPGAALGVRGTHLRIK